MTECRLAFSLCTPSMYTYTHIFIYPTVTAVPRTPPPPPPSAAPAPCVYFNLSAARNCFFVHFVKWIFHVAHRNYLEFVCSCASPISLIYTHYPLYHIYIYIGIYISIIFLCGRVVKFLSRRQLILWLHAASAEKRKCSEFKLDFCAH